MSMAGKRYLVTGGTGFLGSALVKGLLAQGAFVRVLDDGSRGRPRRLAGVLDLDRLELIDGDVRDFDAVRRASEGIDSVCHLAYVNGTEFFYTRPDLVLDVAVKGMVNVLEACKANAVAELILASSSEVYQTPSRVPTPEDVPLIVPDVHNPRYSYGGGKILCELMALHVGGVFLERVVIFRPHNVYGPDMGGEHVVPQFALRLRRMLEQARPAEDRSIVFPIQGTGEETRAFVFVDDWTDAVLRVIERGRHRAIYHVGTDEETSIAELARAMGRFHGQEITIQPGPVRSGGTARRCPDISKLRALGFEPRVTLAEGLARTIPWYDEHWSDYPEPPLS